jgi:hypothetical protein
MNQTCKNVIIAYAAMAPSGKVNESICFDQSTLPPIDNHYGISYMSLCHVI